MDRIDNWKPLAEATIYYGTTDKLMYDKVQTDSQGRFRIEYVYGQQAQVHLWAMKEGYDHTGWIPVAVPPDRTDMVLSLGSAQLAVAPRSIALSGPQG